MAVYYDFSGVLNDDDDDGRCTKLVSFSAKTRPLNKVENSGLRETKRRRHLITIFFSL